MDIEPRVYSLRNVNGLVNLVKATSGYYRVIHWILAEGRAQSGRLQCH